MTQKQSINYLRTFLFFFHSTGILIVSFLPIFLKEKGFSSTDIGWILAIGPFAALIAEPISGFLSDKYKSIKRVLFICILGMIVSSVGLFQMNSFFPFMIGYGNKDFTVSANVSFSSFNGLFIKK